MRTDLDTSKVGRLEVYGAPGCAPSYSIRDFLHRSDIPFNWTELKNDQEAHEKLGVAGLHDDKLPVVFFPDGTRFNRPTIRQITDGFTIRAAANTI
jgi:thioredoxin reductase (NADPH)